MSRAQIITLSVVCCVFGGLALDGPDSVRGGAFAVNFVLVIVCIVVAGLDLTRRGWSLGYLFAATYLVPFIGLIVYVGLCNRPIQEPAIAPSSDLARHGDAVLPPAYPSDEEVASQRRPSASPRVLFGGVDSVSAQPLS
jgi:ABC-type xylose transport system permease subunit